MSLGHLYVLLGKVSTQVLCPFFNWIFCLPGVVSDEFFTYFGNQTHVQYIIGKYVSHKVGSPFILMVASSAVQKLYFEVVPLFTFSFISLAAGDRSANIPLRNI